jgi:hypothetical protein
MVPDGSVASGGAQVVGKTNGVAFGSCGNLFISVWRGANTAENLRLQGRHLTDFVRRRVGNSGFLCVIEESSPVPNQDMRELHTEVLRKLGSDLGCIGCVIEGGSMRASVVRSVLVGISILQRTQQATSYFANATAAHEWMQRRLSTATTAVAVQSAIDSIRAAID